MGFNMSELVEGKGWKKFMAKLYGWGASVVIVGALFKIMHWPFAGALLTIGLLTEAVIFFFSAFEPIHEEIDWTLVYPELAGIDFEEDDEAGIKKASKESALEKFDGLLERAEITPELFDKLGTGLRNLNQTTEKLADVSDATAATNNYVANFERASEKVSEFADNYGQSASKLNNSAEKLSMSYESSADVVNQSAAQYAESLATSGTELTQKLAASGNELTNIVSKAGADVTELVNRSAQELAESYSQLTSAINEEMSKSTEGNKTYGEQLEVMTKNLTALNAVYELQLQGANEHLDATKSLYGGMGEMMENLNRSVEDTKRYREEVSKLGQNLVALNTIYGNMLSAMNYSTPQQG